MHIVLVAATRFEIAPTLQYLEHHTSPLGDGSYQMDDLQITPLVTGAGLTATAWHLGRFMAQHTADLAINAGIAGAFDPAFALGDVVQVVSDRFGDFGVEEADGRFTDLFDLDFMDPDAPPFSQGVLHNPDPPLPHWPLAAGLSVQKVHGHAPSIAAVRGRYPDAQIETMEGAAFFYACLQSDTPFLSLRAISNRVEPRNRAAWEVGKSITALNGALVGCLEELIFEN